MGETTWGSWALRGADADLGAVVAEATAVLPPQVREPLVELAGDYYQSLDAALAYEAPSLLADHLVRARLLLAELAAAVDRATLLRSLCDVLGRHVDPETRALVDTLVGQTVLMAGQRPPPRCERVSDGQARDLAARLFTHVVDGRHDEARVEVVRALEDGAAPHVLLEEVLAPLLEALLAHQDAVAPTRQETDRQQELVRTLLFSLVPPDLSFPTVTRRVLLAEPVLPAGWRAGLSRLLFETAGWHVDTVPAESCPETWTWAAAAHASQVVVVHAGRAADLDGARSGIAAVRSAAPAACVLAQGRPFRAAPALAARLGADAGCGGPASVVDAATALVVGGRRGPRPLLQPEAPSRG